MYRSYTGTLTAFTGAPPGLHQGVAVALAGSVWDPVELRCVPVVPGAGPVVSGAAPVVAGPSQ
ncbi:hypothetical protein DPMN_126611 [Dreissena polymorpha]|uniref:Uncharacterized protein n=1 Tax=Dreissena polymorpha TaxID=45954 RepID=A0A9D4GZP6_DREPO|nr:hypothetical protein DPMN_126611 [Dreissena polymorpha]